MFIKKDLRKIPEILEDENDERHDLKLSKRLDSSQVTAATDNSYMCIIIIVINTKAM
jgi:hypothetical protein